MLREEDKRNFKRYTSESECEVTVGAETYKGKVLDYSDGAGVILENCPGLAQGTTVQVRIFDHDLEFSGEIAWAGKSGDSVRAGIRRVDGFEGDLRDFILADILIGLNRSVKTGTLEIKIGSTVKKVFMDKGDMIFSSSSNEDDRLGEHLLKKGEITLSQYDQASELLKKTGQKLGKILVEIGSLTPKKLFREVRVHTEEIIISLFAVTEGKFKFKEEPYPSDETIILQISAANIIYNGIKRISNFVYVKKMCPDSDDILNISLNPVRIFQALNLQYADRKILSLINGLYPLKTILSLSPLSNFETLKTISAFMTIGLVHVRGEDEAPAELHLEEIFEAAELESPQDFLREIEEAYIRCESPGYFERLGIEKDATDEDVRKAFFRLSKKFHPDRHLAFPSHDIKDKLLKITAETTEAYEILSDPEKRVQYLKTVVTEAPEKAMAEDGMSSASMKTGGADSTEVIEEEVKAGMEHIETPKESVSAAGAEAIVMYEDSAVEHGNNMDEVYEGPPESDVPPEEIDPSSGMDEPLTDESGDRTGEESVHLHDEAEDDFEDVIENETVLVTTAQAGGPKKGIYRKKAVFLPVIMIMVILLLSLAVPLYLDRGPSLDDKALTAVSGKIENKKSIFSFHEQAIKKYLPE